MGRQRSLGTILVQLQLLRPEVQQQVIVAIVIDVFELPSLWCSSGEFCGGRIDRCRIEIIHRQNRYRHDAFGLEIDVVLFVAGLDIDSYAGIGRPDVNRCIA